MLGLRVSVREVVALQVECFHPVCIGDMPKSTVPKCNFQVIACVVFKDKTAFTHTTLPESSISDFQVLRP